MVTNGLLMVCGQTFGVVVVFVMDAMKEPGTGGIVDKKRDEERERGGGEKGEGEEGERRGEEGEVMTNGLLMVCGQTFGVMKVIVMNATKKPKTWGIKWREEGREGDRVMFSFLFSYFLFLL